MVQGRLRVGFFETDSLVGFLKIEESGLFLNLQTFRQRRQEMARAPDQRRTLCQTCLQPDFGCYCPHLQVFDPQIKFVILMHPIEARRRIATGRMSHLCLQGSELIVGQDYTGEERVNQILKDSTYSPVVLYPGKNSHNLSISSIDEQRIFFSDKRKPLVFVIDGTWATARKMMYQSRNLFELPRICFTPLQPSRFRVRKQPGPECYSTIEAIHHTIDLLRPVLGLGSESRSHDGLLKVFDYLVEKQLAYVQRSRANPRRATYRRERPPAAES